ncbi:serine/threonine-protein kinase [Streptomyces platensis]|uniref:serine/threonine-protein kinase n=1 Tax=Streptomyces platensis TaxID=58346 RepID=UPI003C30138B
MSGPRRGGDAELTGRLLGGRYRVTGRIGRGGMGVVCRAVDEVLGREVAVKVLRAYTDASAPELADLRTRMQREARAAARIRHSGVITVHDVIDEDGRPVIVMELVDGPSLDDVLEQQGALDPREIARIGAQVLDALDAAHQAGVLHRDVKPGNVLLDNWGHRPGSSGTGGGRVVLTDFGIASIEAPGDGATTHLTRSGELVGSLDYLPPERAQGQDPTPASDIWSLGMTLYAAVEGGGAPFRRTSVWSTLTAIVTEALPEPRRAGPLTPVLHALMAKNPADRPSAAHARDLLAAVAEGREPTPLPVPGAPHPPTVSDVRAAGVPFVVGEGGPTEPTPLPSSPPPPSPPPPPPLPTPPAPPAGHSVPPSAATGPYPSGSAEGDTARVPARGRRRVLPAVAAVLAVLAAGGGLTYALVGGGGASETVADGGRPSARPAGPPSGPDARDAAGGKAGGGEDGKGKNKGNDEGRGGGKSVSPSASDRPSDGGGAKGTEPGGANGTPGGQDGGSGGSQGGTDGGASGGTGGDGGSGGDEPTPGASCQSIGGGKTNCDVWRSAHSYTASFEQVGTLDMGTNYFYCQAKLGRRETYGKWTNVWWARTDDDSGNSGVYISVVYLKGGENDQPVPGLPTC